jgi:Mg-chelatase subunit ChlD
VAKKVHVGIVLDRSGSMEDCRTDAVGAVNSYLRQLKDDTDMEADVSLMIFDSQSIDLIRDHVPAQDCAELGLSEYQPRAATPLLDAVGHGVAVLEKHATAGERRILAIMTDGLENASKEYTTDTIKLLLYRKQKQEGWLVLYLGANHDAWGQARAIGLHAGNVAAFHKGAVRATMQALGSRAARYTKAANPAQEAAAGGFTERERSGMLQPNPTKTH